MQQREVTFSVFTKPWKTQSLDELGTFVSGLGFEGIEFPLRDGYQVEPADAEQGLVRLVKKVGQYDLKVTSVAGGLTENVFAGCAAAGIPVIRIMANTDRQTGFWSFMDQKRKELDAVIPWCEKYGIKVAVQHHYGPGVHNSMELYHLVEGYDPRYIGAIWDSAHSALAGEEPEQGLEIVWSHLCMVNLKNAFYHRTSGPEAEQSEWKRYLHRAGKG